MQTKTRTDDNTASRDCALRAAEIVQKSGFFKPDDRSVGRGTIFGELPVAALRATHPGRDGQDQPAESEEGEEEAGG